MNNIVWDHTSSNVAGLHLWYRAIIWYGTVHVPTTLNQG